MKHRLWASFGMTRDMTQSIKNNKPLLARVRRIAGQTQALEEALLSQTDCSLILQQLAAVRGAINGLMAEVLDGYLREYVTPAEALDEARSRDLAQVSRVLHAYLK
jgi:DNA-binding FrmR family transcriptional regulator